MNRVALLLRAGVAGIVIFVLMLLADFALSPVFELEPVIVPITKSGRS